jgi:hypothetical protein
MQVKCVVQNEGGAYQPDGVVYAIEQRGSAVLNNFAVQNQILLKKLDTTGLHILGGRSSIVHWLRLQAQDPTIVSEDSGGRAELWLKVLRKHRTFGKDLTLVSIHPYPNRTREQDGWREVGPGGPLHPNGLSWRDRSEILPGVLADRLERWLL